MEDVPQKPHKKRTLPKAAEPYKFKPGNRANPGGRPKGSISIVARIRKLLAEGLEGKDLVEALSKAGLNKALRGDFKFWQEIVNRIDGKVPDRIAGADGEPLTINIFKAGKPKKQDADG